MSESIWRRSRRFWSPSVQDDVDSEMTFHVQMRIDQFIAAGMSRIDAERAAGAQFGDVVAVRAELVGIGASVRRHRDWRDRLSSIHQDVVISLRSLRRAPLFTAGVIITLGLGIGANATMFGIIDHLILRGPEDVVDANRIQRLYISYNQANEGTQTTVSFGWVTYALLRDHAQSFSAVAAYSPPYPTPFGSGAGTHPVQMARATWDLFPALGVHAARGRFFDATQDHPPLGDKVVVVSYEFWQSELGGDERVIGQPVLLGGDRYVVVGVAPPGFTGPERQHADVWQPMSLTTPTSNWPTTYNAQWLRVVARLKPGVTPERASLEATTILRAAYNGDKPYMRELTAFVRPLWYGADGRASAVANVSRWLMGVAVIVLLITAANVANLLMARTRRRKREIGVRLALGAGRGALLRLLLTETMLVSLGGGAAALAVAFGGGALMRKTLLSTTAWTGTALDGRVFGFTLLVAIVVGFAVGLVPALEALRLELTNSLKTGDRSATEHRRGVQTALTIGQAALSVVLLAGAALFVVSLTRVRGVDLGFQPDRVIRADPRFTISHDDKDWRVRRAQVYVDALDHLRNLPWIESAAIAVGTPWGNGFCVGLAAAGRDSIPCTSAGPWISAVSADFFATMGTPLRRGRAFTNADHAGTTPVAIVGEAMAKMLWPGSDPIGKCLMVGDHGPKDPPLPCTTVVGVVSDLHRESVRETPSWQLYVPLGQENGFGGSVLLIRPRGTTVTPLALARQAFASMPVFTYTRLETIQASIDPEFRPWQLGAAMFGVFGLLALIVAGVGLYSVIAYLVVERTREFGVRVALGATGGRIVRDVVLGGVSTCVAGVALGIVITLIAGRLIEPMLFDISPRNPFVLSGVSAVVVAIAIAASWIPARRASRVDPVIALRAD